MPRISSPTIVILFACGVCGCNAVVRHAEPENLPTVEPKILGNTTAAKALEEITRIKKNGENNMIFALSFSEAPPKELNTHWGTLDYAFSKLSPCGITYLPWDFQYPSNTPGHFPPGTGIVSRASPYVWVKDESTGNPYRVINPDFEPAFAFHKNKDGSNPDYWRLRMSLSYDRDVRTVNRGVIIRALAKVGSETIEPSFDTNADTSVSRLTVQLGYTDLTGAIGQHNVIVSANVVRLGAEDRYGLIVSSNGGFYYDKATVTHSLSDAVNEVVGHAVFILMAKHLGLDYEAILASSRHGGRSGSGLSGLPRDASPITYRVVAGRTHEYSTGDRIRVSEIRGDSIVVDLANPNAGAQVQRRRMYVGQSLAVNDPSTKEVRKVQLINILYKTTAEFRETIQRADQS